MQLFAIGAGVSYAINVIQKQEVSVGLITIPKKVLIAVDSSVSEIAAEIDAFGEASEAAAPILAQIAALQLKLAPLGITKKKLEEKLAKLGLDDDVKDHVERGASYEATIGKKGSSRDIVSMDAVKKAMGPTLFMQLATVKLGDMDKYMTPPQLEALLTTTRTKHSVTVTKRG